MFNLPVSAQEIEYEKTISLGMPKDQVLLTLGLPTTKRQFPDGTEVWIYVISSPENNTKQYVCSVIFDPAGKVNEILLPQKEKTDRVVDIQIER
jgi:outer membrane protein assembly factor BamE (lipoprotein component of BamABCDE complex)